MTPVQALSKLLANILSPSSAWDMARAHLHESMGWSAVLAHALKTEPALNPELFNILSTVNTSIPEKSTSIGVAFKKLKTWASTQDEQMLATALAIWAAQTQVDGCTVADLVKSTALSWKWDLAVALMPGDQIRAEHQTLVHVLWMNNMARNQSKDQNTEPSISPTVFSP